MSLKYMKHYYFKYLYLIYITWERNKDRSYLLQYRKCNIMWSYNIYKIFGIRYSEKEEGAKRGWYNTKQWLFYVYICLWFTFVLVRFVDEYATWSTERHVFEKDWLCCYVIKLYLHTHKTPQKNGWWLTNKLIPWSLNDISIIV